MTFHVSREEFNKILSTFEFTTTYKVGKVISFVVEGTSYAFDCIYLRNGFASLKIYIVTPRFSYNPKSILMDLPKESE